ncbi:Ion transport protein, putative [Angomonas deanei]|uniref:Ion transport protein, putative n=1 Tax=Angomonas deanei TaxID=59799 RepID=A0A7G2C0E9_9TRYP|nr:Ion transport protein, putative [Angomonas deanei]
MRKYIIPYLLNYCANEILYIAVIIMLVINLLMLIGLRHSTSPYRDGTSDEIELGINILGIIVICFHGMLLLQAVLGPGVVDVGISWSDWRISREEEISKKARKNIAASREEMLMSDPQLKKVPLYKKIFRSAYYLCTNGKVVRYAFFLFVSIMGYVHHRIWYTILLLQVSISSPVLSTLFRALTANVVPLILTFLLMIFVIFIFTTISFYKFTDLYDPLGSRGNGFNCYSLSQCLLVHLDTLRNTGGIGDTADWPTYYSKDGYGYWFSFFRLAYYVIVMLVVSNLFFGIIVDSLSTSRSIREYILVDQEKKCFICGVERNVFDLVKPGTYDIHIGEEHNMWQYVYFIHYLFNRKKSKLTGQEHYVMRMINSRDVTFFPIGQSIVLSSASFSSMKAAEKAAKKVQEEKKQEEIRKEAERNASTSEIVDALIRRNFEPLKKQLDDNKEAVDSLRGHMNDLNKTLRAQLRLQQQQEQPLSVQKRI